MKSSTTNGVSILAALRALVPERPLRYAEAERITELQANRLRELLGLNEPRLPEEAIADLPRLHVRREFALPASGITHWEQGRWIITLNASEPATRQRFSLVHEFAHVLHHTSRHSLYGGRDGAQRAERQADWFAGCLLMPKRHVKRLFGEGVDQTAMARAFGVSLPAMRYRLLQLGLSEPVPRCDWSRRRAPRSYFRTAIDRTEVAA